MGAKRSKPLAFAAPSLKALRLPFDKSLITVTVIESPATTNAATRNPARRAMIDSQLRTSGINVPAVLLRMGAVERADFVPAAAKRLAYVDRAIRLDNGGWLAAPLVQGMMLQEAAPRGDERAIIVDGGSGYLAALLEPMVAELTVITAEDALGNGRKGKGADLLIVDGAVEQLPAKLIARLADDARIVTGVIENGVTRLAVGRKSGTEAALLAVHDLGIPHLPEFDMPKGWSF